MATLYSTYTVTVQDPLLSPVGPNSGLYLYLFEGPTEIKLTGGSWSVCQLGSVAPATNVLSSTGTLNPVVCADSVNRPGEYDFKNIDFTATSASKAGATLYDVVAVPTSSGANNFTGGSVILSNLALTDPNMKQTFTASYGTTASVSNNIAWAGGTVPFAQDITTGLTNTSTVQYLKLTNLPPEITNQYVTETSIGSPFTSGNKLLARFDVHYSVGAYTAIWKAIPAYYTSSGNWTIKLTNDQYCVKATQPIGPGGIDITSIASSLYIQVSVNMDETNVSVRRYDTTPVTNFVYTRLSNAEIPAIQQTFSSLGNPITAIGKGWDYSGATYTAPAYTLDIQGGNTTPADSGLRYCGYVGGVFHEYLKVTPLSVTLKSTTDTILSYSSGFTTIGTSTTYVQTMVNRFTIYSGSYQLLNYDTSTSTPICYMGADLITGLGGGSVPMLIGNPTTMYLAGSNYPSGNIPTTYISAAEALVTGSVGSRVASAQSFFLNASNTSTILGFNTAGGGSLLQFASGLIYLTNGSDSLLSYVSGSALNIGYKGITAPYLSSNSSSILLSSADNLSNINVNSSTVSLMSNNIPCFMSAGSVTFAGYNATGTGSGLFGLSSNSSSTQIQATTSQTALFANTSNTYCGYKTTTPSTFYGLTATSSSILLSMGSGTSSVIFNASTSSAYPEVQVGFAGSNLTMLSMVNNSSSSYASLNSPQIVLTTSASVSYTPSASISASLTTITGTGHYSGVAAWVLPSVVVSAGVPTVSDLAPTGALVVRTASGTPSSLYINAGTATTPAWYVIQMNPA